MQNVLTLSETNQFSFVCPLFNTQTKLASCMKLRELKWMGKEIQKDGVTIRRGCQAAMDCGKCPAAEIVTMTIYHNNKQAWPDDHGSAEPVVGKLRANVLERILRPAMREDIMQKRGVPEHERELLLTANSRIEAQLKSAPKGEGRSVSRVSASAGPVTHKPRKKVVREDQLVETTPQRNDAALTGDMAAALNG